ncbi:MAG: RecX family transcriptional regulator [Bacteroidetes bacterium]|nr:RecX family transcriptional regulator [Bacteroidota bacterium]
MKKEEQKKITDPQQALVRAEAWCAYQERCQQEVRDKLFQWGLYPGAVENIISELILKNFINEERFAIAYAGGKFRIKKWGRIKIRVELKRRKLSDYCISKAMKEIDEKDYRKTLGQIAEKKMKEVKEKNELKKKYKVMSYLISRGFESELVREIVIGH